MCFLCQQGPGYLWGEIKANDLRTAVHFRTDLEMGVDYTSVQVASIYRPTNVTNKMQTIEHNSWQMPPLIFLLYILYYDQQMHNYFTNYHTATCFDTIVSSSGSL